jgi:uncharacterized pyridoxamine 5'-phosphate oxidase family protein
MLFTIAIVAYLFVPNTKILLEPDTKIYILPTKHSTIFNKLEQKELVEIINKKKNYLKVLFENKNIGWIKNDK